MLTPTPPELTPLSDIIRLLGLLAIAYAAYRDFGETIPNRIWSILLAIGGTAILVDIALAQPHSAFPTMRFLKGGIGILLTSALGFGAWRAGWIGGADAKAVICLGVLFPWTPRYFLELPGLSHPIHFPIVFVEGGLFPISTIVINIVLLYLLSPLFVGTYNAITGQFDRRMFSAIRCTPETALTFNGTAINPDLRETHCTTQVLKDYADWQEAPFDTIRANPDRYRQPTRSDGGPTDPTLKDLEDAWQAVAFVQETQPSTGNVTPSGVRTALDTLVDTPMEHIWIRPYLPIMPWLLFGTALSISLGNLIWATQQLL